MTENTELLATRYGQTKKLARRNRSLGILTAVGFTAVLGAWLWWGGVLEQPSQLQYRDISHVVVNDREVLVQYEVTTQPGTEVACAVQALNASYGIVAWKVVRLEPATQWTRTFEEPLVTSERAVTGLLYECWLP